MITGLAFSVLSFMACGDGPTSLPTDMGPSNARLTAETVQDLAGYASTGSSVVLSWTEVNDGEGNPASYTVRYSRSSLDWSTALEGCGYAGTEIGAAASCTVDGLAAGTEYEFQLMAYRAQGNAQLGGAYSNLTTVSTPGTAVEAPDAPGSATAVQDLAGKGSTDSSITVRWTQVDDGTGAPARYRLRLAPSPMTDWKSAEQVCDVVGDAIGAEASCTAAGLSAGTSYDFQLMSYRVVDGVWQDAQYSNVATAETVSTDGTAPAGGTPYGIWISAEEIAGLPMTGLAWNGLLSAAGSSCGLVDLTDQEQTTNVCIMAKALVFARTGLEEHRTEVRSAISQIVHSGTYTGRALALGRELVSYVIAADLIDLPAYDPSLDASFRDKLRELRTTYTTGASTDLIDCHERRPNNWGAHCGATRAAIAVYLGDDADLARAAQVFKGYIGDRSAYAGFVYGGPDDDLTWQCDPTRPVGINPKGCTRNGLRMDGILPDDQRRGGSFTTSPPKENYVWEALQGLLAQAIIYYRAGYTDVWEWEDRALLRAVEWLHEVVDYPAEGDDAWQPHIVNHYYGTSFPAPIPSRPGKNVGWTDWTHR